MSNKIRRLYWDSSCFICFLNRDELKRRAICEEILRAARDKKVTLYTSMITITEVIYPKRSSLPHCRKLTPMEADKISGMFKWKWIKKINVDERISTKAVELARDYNLLPNDSIHAATAILQNVDVLQRWDRDFGAVAHLVNVEDPTPLTLQTTFSDMLPRIGPHPDDFESV